MFALLARLHFAMLAKSQKKFVAPSLTKSWIRYWPLEAAKKKWGYSPDCCLTLPSIGKNHCCIEEYPHIFLQVRGVPSYFFASQRSTLIFFCKSEEYPHIFLQVRGVPSYFFASQRSTLIFFCKSGECPHIFLQVRGVPSYFFASFRSTLIFFCNSRRKTEPIRAWSYPVRTRSCLYLVLPSWLLTECEISRNL